MSSYIPQTRFKYEYNILCRSFSSSDVKWPNYINEVCWGIQFEVNYLPMTTRFNRVPFVNSSARRIIWIKVRNEMRDCIKDRFFTWRSCYLRHPLILAICFLRIFMFHLWKAFNCLYPMGLWEQAKCAINITQTDYKNCFTVALCFGTAFREK